MCSSDLHAKAQHVDVRFTCENGSLRVEIADDGQGFDPARLPTVHRPRFGLQTMRERAAAIRGSFAVSSMPGHGTRVVVTIPAERS